MSLVTYHFRLVISFYLIFLCVSQETRIWAAEKDPHSKAQNICITNQYGGEEVTHTLTADSREDTQRWMEAFWQQFYDMSEFMNSKLIIKP